MAGDADHARRQAEAGKLFKQISSLRPHESSKAHKLCERIFEHLPDDQDAHAVNVAAYILSSKWQACVSYITPKLRPQFACEYAYCLYRMDHLEDALQVVGPIGSAHNPWTMDHVPMLPPPRARLSYRAAGHSPAPGITPSLSARRMTSSRS
eukprot:gene3178-612_t